MALATTYAEVLQAMHYFYVEDGFPWDIEIYKDGKLQQTLFQEDYILPLEGEVIVEGEIIASLQGELYEYDTEARSQQYYNMRLLIDNSIHY
jgi:hypothetical protein